MKNQRQTVKDY